MDFTIYSDKDRRDYIEKILEEKKNPSPRELEFYANFILYGKDPNGESVVDRKEVEIATRYSSYKKKKEVSLDELMETPTFNEASLSPLKKSIYKKPKQTLPKDDEQLKPLRDSIEELEKVLSARRELLEKNPTNTQLQTQIYKLTHNLIELKKSQYVLKDFVAPALSLRTSYHFMEETDPTGALYFLPLGLINEANKKTTFKWNCYKSLPLEDKKFEVPKEKTRTIDFENPLHIYYLIEHYVGLVEEANRDKTSTAYSILETLNFYTTHSNLSPDRQLLLQLKKSQYTNKQIQKELFKYFGKDYKENYISTIYKNEICKKISEAASLHFDRWVRRFDVGDWKICSCCGEWRLKDEREFIKKKRNGDGFNNKCKECERKEREEKKYIKGEKLEDRI